MSLEEDAEYQAALDAAARKGMCLHSGLTLRECKSWLCDCFDYPNVKP